MIRLQRRYTDHTYHSIHTNCIYMYICVRLYIYTNSERIGGGAVGRRYGTGKHDTAAAQVQLRIRIISFTETKKHSPNTVARAKHIHVCVCVCIQQLRALHEARCGPPVWSKPI